MMQNVCSAHMAADGPPVMGRPRIAVLLTGGTIVCAYERESGLCRPTYRVEDLLAQVPELEGGFTLLPETLFNIPGTQLTLAHGLEIVRALERCQSDPDVDGAVVIQGTDTLDEIAYLAGLLVKGRKPVVFTGAMKSFHEHYQDAAGNLAGAIRAAADPHARGVMVYMNQLLFDPADVEKVHSNRVDAFQSFRGPIGSVENGRVLFWRRPASSPRYQASRLVENIPIIKCYAGMDGLLVDASLAAGCPGIVMEGLGSGNVQPCVVPALRRALDRHIPVVAATRCFSGATFGAFDYEGGGANLQKMGVIFLSGLSSQKARIKLSVLLSAGVPEEEIALHFNPSYPQYENE